MIPPPSSASLCTAPRHSLPPRLWFPLDGRLLLASLVMNGFVLLSRPRATPLPLCPFNLVPQVQRRILEAVLVHHTSGKTCPVAHFLSHPIPELARTPSFLAVSHCLSSASRCPPSRHFRKFEQDVASPLPAAFVRPFLTPLNHSI